MKLSELMERLGQVRDQGNGLVFIGDVYNAVLDYAREKE